MYKDYLIVGYVIATHGLRGLVKVKPATSFIDERFSIGEKLYIEDNETFKVLTIENASMYKGIITLTLAEILSIDEAETIVKKALLVKRANAKLDEGFYYLDDLLAMDVVLEDDTHIGKVTEILEYASYYTLRVKRENASDLLIPYIDEFIISTSLDGKKIVFRPLEGML